MAQSNHKTPVFTRLIHRLFGRWLELQIVLRGWRYEIIRSFGRAVCYARGPQGIEWAWKEVHKPARLIQFPSKLSLVEPEPLWKQRIAFINERCEEAKTRRLV